MNNKKNLLINIEEKESIVQFKIKADGFGESGSAFGGFTYFFGALNPNAPSIDYGFATYGGTISDIKYTNFDSDIEVHTLETMIDTPIIDPFSSELGYLDVAFWFSITWGKNPPFSSFLLQFTYNDKTYEIPGKLNYSVGSNCFGADFIYKNANNGDTLSESEYALQCMIVDTTSFYGSDTISSDIIIHCYK